MESPKVQGTSSPSDKGSPPLHESSKLSRMPFSFSFGDAASLLKRRSTTVGIIKPDTIPPELRRTNSVSMPIPTPHQPGLPAEEAMPATSAVSCPMPQHFAGFWESRRRAGALEKDVKVLSSFPSV
eukprot:RCo032245